MEERSQMQKIADVITKTTKHEFSEVEQKENAHRLAQIVKDKSVKESEKKSMMTQFKDELEKMDKEMKVVSNYVNDGYMYKDVPCELWLDYDLKKRLYLHKSTGEVIASEDFHNSDYQKLLDFQAAEEKERIFEENRQREISENNAAGEFAENGVMSIVKNDDGEVSDITGKVSTSEDEDWGVSSQELPDLVFPEALPKENSDVDASNNEDNEPF